MGRPVLWVFLVEASCSVTVTQGFNVDNGVTVKPFRGERSLSLCRYMTGEKTMSDQNKMINKGACVTLICMLSVLTSG